MEGKIFGIPLAIIILVLFIAALVDLPMVYLYGKTQEEIYLLRLTVNEMNARRPIIITPTEAPVVTPTDEPTPTKKLRSTVTPTPEP